MRLRPEPAPMMSSPPATAAEERAAPVQAEFSDPMEPPLLSLDGGATESGDFISPFEDELDVPTFLRRSAD
jgi:hypothetical protein